MSARVTPAAERKRRAFAALFDLLYQRVPAYAHRAELLAAALVYARACEDVARGEAWRTKETTHGR